MARSALAPGLEPALPRRGRLEARTRRRRCVPLPDRATSTTTPALDRNVAGATALVSIELASKRPDRESDTSARRCRRSRLPAGPGRAPSDRREYFRNHAFSAVSDRRKRASLTAALAEEGMRADLRHRGCRRSRRATKTSACVGKRRLGGSPRQRCRRLGARLGGSSERRRSRRRLRRSRRDDCNRDDGTRIPRRAEPSASCRRRLSWNRSVARVRLSEQRDWGV